MHIIIILPSLREMCTIQQKLLLLLLDEKVGVYYILSKAHYYYYSPVQRPTFAAMTVQH